MAWAAIAAACRTDSPARDPGPPAPTNLAAGEEWIPPGEAQDVEQSKSMLLSLVERNFKASGVAHRDAHVKAHGCVKATVRIEDHLPPHLSVGLFAEPRSYPAWVRYSNSADHAARDRKPDGRGMAIKLMNVPGPKALPGHESGTSHDIVLIDYPVFVVKNARDYVLFTKDTTVGHPLRFFFQKGRSYMPELASAAKLSMQKVVSVLAPTYYSMTPYQFGEGMAIKYGARPCESDRRRRRKLGRNYLRDQLSEDLAGDGACYDLLVQRQVDPARMPLEDPTVSWPTSLADYETVARIDIPAQEFDTSAQNEMCEYLSFNPWHARTEHRPLGGINRVRAAVYIAVSQLRHRLAGVAELEPVDHNVEAYLAAIRTTDVP